MQLKFCGAAQQVTGSSFLLETAASRFLVDCGMFRGARDARERNLAPFAFDLAASTSSSLRTPTSITAERYGYLARLPTHGEAIQLW